MAYEGTLIPTRPAVFLVELLQAFAEVSFLLHAQYYRCVEHSDGSSKHPR
jgi:hypothetical protein